MDFAESLGVYIQQCEHLEIVHPALLTTDLVLESGVLGIRKPALYSAWTAVAADFRSPCASLLALVAVTEHQSAANYRKSMLLQGTLDLTKELHILDVLLSSPLPKHTKSPVLWSHRRFVLDLLDATSIVHEWLVVSKAAEAHPTNYYAWTHLRLVASDNPSILATQVWELCCRNLSDVSMWTFLVYCAGPQYVSQARDLYNRWPHAAMLPYLQQETHCD